MVSPDNLPVSEPGEMLPGMEDMFPPVPDPEAEAVARGVIAAGIRDNAFRQAARRSESEAPTRQSEVAVDQGVANEAMAHGRIEATGAEEPPADKKPATPRKKKVYQERDGRGVSTDIANAAYVEGAGEPMSPEARAIKAQLQLEADLRRAGGDARTAVTYAANRDHRNSKKPK